MTAADQQVTSKADPEYSINDSRYTPEENNRFEKLGLAEDAAQKRVSGNDDKKFAPLFAAANEKIDMLASDANQKKDGIDADLKKSIKEVVHGLASDLKALGFPVNRIANEIVHQLKRKASRSWILEILPNEYKDKSHQESAKGKHKVPPVQQDNSGEIAPLPERQSRKATTSNQVAPQQERKQLLKVGADGHETIDAESESGNLGYYYSYISTIRIGDMQLYRTSPLRPHCFEPVTNVPITTILEWSSSLL
jgi:hypothetical protein